MAARTTTRAELTGVSLEELRARAIAHETRGDRSESTDDGAGIELFRRAIEERDDAAWHSVIDIYRRLLCVEAGRRAVRGLVGENDGFCVDRAFQRFWSATRRNATRGRADMRVQCDERPHLPFDDLGSVLKYLKLCLASVLLDEARARRRAQWVSLDELEPARSLSADAADQVVGQMARRALWAAVNAALTNPDERLVARLSFIAGLSPREMLRRHPDRFADICDVYRIKRSMVERLRRDSTLQELHAETELDETC